MNIVNDGIAPIETGENKAHRLLTELCASIDQTRTELKRRQSQSERMQTFTLVALLFLMVIIASFGVMGTYWLYTHKEPDIMPVAKVDTGENRLMLEALSQHITNASGNTILALTGKLYAIAEKLDQNLAKKPETVIKNYYYNRPKKAIKKNSTSFSRVNESKLNLTRHQ